MKEVVVSLIDSEVVHKIFCSVVLLRPRARTPPLKALCDATAPALPHAVVCE